MATLDFCAGQNFHGEAIRKMSFSKGVELTAYADGVKLVTTCNCSVSKKLFLLSPLPPKLEPTRIIRFPINV